MIGGRQSPETLLCVANFSTNVGYAWDFIERLYAQLADELATTAIRTYVAYPRMIDPPRTLSGSSARPVRLNASLASIKSLLQTLAFVRRHRVRVVYFTDCAPRRASYLLLRLAGVRCIIVHDHTSGARDVPRGARRALKWLLARVPGVTADVVVAVSEYVARRQRDVALVPADRVVRIWNGLPPRVRTPNGPTLAELVHAARHRPIIACACRATPEKGVAFLLRAFDTLVMQQGKEDVKPLLVYFGDGPQIAELRALRDTLESREDIVLAGFHPDAAALVANAHVAVVPSVWQDAFPLAVLETMAAGRPIVATRVGGIPEMIEDEVTGLLVPPADETALAAAIGALLKDRARAERLGAAACRRVSQLFTPEQQITALTTLVAAGFGRTLDPSRAQ